MKLCLVVAMARNRVIGRGNSLPWHLPADLTFFKRITLGKPILMGRKTFESIGRPLPQRRNIVITENRHYRAAGCLVVYSLREALAAAEPALQAMIIGGASLYRQTLPRASRIYLTQVEADIAGDTYFPEFDRTAWREVWRKDHPADAQHAYPYRFLLLKRQRVD